MIISQGGEKRVLQSAGLQVDLAVIGGGVSGTCAAITAAREGLKVVLVQDRPVLGGNASSEVRLWMLGATSHMGNNNRWAREGGVVDELMVENVYRNPEGNPLIFDMVLLDKVVAEPNITLLLNTAVYDVEKSSADEISSLKAFCSQNSTEYIITAPLFCDASGDGIVAFLAGAAFRMGAESKEEFGELFAPTKEYGELLGHSLYFYSKDTGKPVKFVAPSYALDDITKVPRFRNFNAKEYGCKLWWLEYGGRLDTVHDTEKIKWELWKVAYGAWNYIKNSGNFPEAENLTLEWIGTIPGKRESRRFEGEYMIKQQDVVQQHLHDDAVAFGGWSIDLHPADGVFSEKPGCNQWHGKGIYQIPYRSLYSRNIKNLFLAGRIISATHVAFGSTRVMATAAHAAQAVAMAAKICKDRKILPADVYHQGFITELQTALLRTGHHIPNVVLDDPEDLVGTAVVTASSELLLDELPEAGLLKPLEFSIAQMIPLKKGKCGTFSFHAESEEATELEVQFRVSEKSTNHTPEIILDKIILPVNAGRNELRLQFDVEMKDEAYAFVTFMKNPKIKLHFSNKRVTGILSVFNSINKAVSNFGKQTPPADIGVDEFEFWCPKRRPEGQNVAFKYEPGIDAFQASNITNGIDRPAAATNAWVADWNDENPTITIDWKETKTIKRIEILFDTDYDHPMESVLMGHPEHVMPFCVRDYVIKDGEGKVIFSKTDNYQTRNIIELDQPVNTKSLAISLVHPSADVPAALFSVRCY
ncbi:FAD-dependent oxidoreductase [Pedobacter hiemivivus]|uniref:FAD-dependent oxidoreductase n=1 Tax=Pedobacter hiemivivus TaxID=2530454 RepID=A0A4U1GQW1_9SPHI|nr:FAD-dependent oxidoreductase [Pedobacter hiemivivus]TKC65583.1 FAD-dependent oxidoreductase [Pedobacter hiemivivus]